MNANCMGGVIFLLYSGPNCYLIAQQNLNGSKKANFLKLSSVKELIISD
jgi:hypothetical protein